MSTPDVHVCPVRMCGAKLKPPVCIHFCKHLDQNILNTDRTAQKGRQILQRWQKEEFRKTNHHVNLEEGTTAEPGVHFCLVHVHGQVQVHVMPSPV